MNDSNDPRNRLFADFFRIVAELRPKFFVAENVPGLLREQHLWAREAAIAHVAHEYVVLPPIMVAANDYGAPTLRSRAFFIGYLPDEIDRLTSEDFRPPPGITKVHVGDALKGLPGRIDPAWQDEDEGWRVARVGVSGPYGARLHGHLPLGVGDSTALERLRKEGRASGSLGTQHSAEVVRRFAKVEPGRRDPVSKAPRLTMEGFCPTIRAGTGKERGSFQAVRPLHPTANRVITPREAARLQGFPDWFQFSATKWHSFRQIGGSVSPIVAEHILRILRDAVGVGDWRRP